MKPIYSSTAAVLTILAGVALFQPHMMNAGQGSAATANSTATQEAAPARKVHLAANYGKLPLSFEANQGQTDSRVKFLSRGRGYSLFLTGDEAVLSFQGKVAQHPLSGPFDALRAGSAAIPNPPFGPAAIPEHAQKEVEKPRGWGASLPLRSPRPVAGKAPCSVLRPDA